MSWLFLLDHRFFGCRFEMMRVNYAWPGDEVCFNVRPCFLMLFLDSSNCLVQYWDFASRITLFSVFCIVYIGCQYYENLEIFLRECVFYLEDNKYVLTLK